MKQLNLSFLFIILLSTCTSHQKKTEQKKSNLKSQHQTSWGIPFTWNDLPSEFCNWLGEDFLKSKFYFSQINSCKMVSGPNSAARMMLMDANHEDDNFLVSIFFSNARQHNYDNEIKTHEENKNFGEEIDLSSDKKVRCFPDAKGIKVYLNEKNQFWISIEGNSIRSNAGGRFNTPLIQVAEEIITKLDK